MSSVRAAKERSISYLYAIGVDYAAHEYGTNAPQTMEALHQLDTAIEGLARSLPPNTRIVLTADHGQLNGTAHEIVTDKSARRAPLTRALGRCERDALRRETGDEVQFEANFRRKYGDVAFLLTVNEVETLELLGPGRIEDAARKRLGTHLAISRGADVFLYRSKSDSMNSSGTTPALTPDEMLVPLIVV